MSAVWLCVIVVGAATIAIKGAGPVLAAGRELPHSASRVVDLLAPALLAALVATQAFATDEELVLDERGAGLLAGGVAILLLAPLLFTVLGDVGSVNSPVQHSLLVTSASWGILWMPLVLRVGLYSNSGGRKKNTSWLAGAFLALAHICDRAACDKDGIRATKVGRPFNATQQTLTFSSGCCPFSPS